MEDLQTLKNILNDLRVQLSQGEIYQSLNEELDIVELKIPERSRIVIKPGQPAEATIELISELSADLIDPDTAEVTDDQLLEILQQLGNPDAAVRDQGAFYYISDALSSGIFTDAQKKWMTEYLIDDERLFGHIFEGENDGIYLRAFSVLVVSLLLRSNRIDRVFIDEDLMELIIQQLSLYAFIEKDTRGFIGSHGWAHAFTHVANTFEELVFYDDIQRSDKIFMMAVLLSNLASLQTPLITGEIQSIVIYLVKLMEKNDFYSDYLLNIMKTWRAEMGKPAGYSEGEWHQIFNRNRFFQGFVLKENSIPKEVADYVRFARDSLS